MVEWAAANLRQDPSSTTKSGSSSSLGPNDDAAGGVSSNPIHKRSKTLETPEAAIARLTASYSHAISAVARLKKSSNAFVKHLKRSSLEVNMPAVSQEQQQQQQQHAYDGDVEDDDSVVMTAVDNKKQNASDDGSFESAVQAVQRDSKVAREAFEISLLSDPLIRVFCPTFDRVMAMNRDHVNMENVPLTSAAHQSAFKELAYASLMNYADLLLSGCGCDSRRQNTETCRSILDRGVVPLLQAVRCIPNLYKVQNETTNNRMPCLWKDMEEEERTQRLALVSYCDACDLDGTDPSIWLKLACAARGLGRVLREKKGKKMRKEEEYGGAQALDQQDDACDNNTVHLEFERLERYALERGLTVLKSSQPANRTLSRAFHEFERERVCPNSIQPYKKSFNTNQQGECVMDSATLMIDLPRYNWATLGRILLRACRDGTTSNPSCNGGWKIHKSWNSNQYKVNEFASPCICIQVSLLLTLPSKVLGKMCTFLQDEDVQRLESTCRSLSVDIIPACALIEKDRISRVRQMEQEMGDMLHRRKDEGAKALEEPKSSTAQNTAAASVHRVSQRVRTQLIESGRQAERSAKWKSVEYCLVTSVLPCSIDHPTYQACLKKELKWDDLESMSECAQMIKNMMSWNDNDSTPSEQKGGPMEKSFFQGDVKCWALQCVHNEKSSMTNFIRKWSGNNSGAREMLQQFILHVSLFVDSIYDGEQGNSMVLTQCFLECFDFITVSNRTPQGILPRWYGNENLDPCDPSCFCETVQVLAVNLLYTELRMKACEQHGVKTLNYEDSLHVIKTNIPLLLHYAESLVKSGIDDSLQYSAMKMLVRTYWLAGIFYVWWSRNTTDLRKVKEAELIALDFIDKAIHVLDGQSPRTVIKAIRTPHLISPGRTGTHWWELSAVSLMHFRNSFQSSTIISRVRQNFANCLVDLQNMAISISTLSANVQANFSIIENDLIERYGIQNGEPTQNLDELITDFIMRHKRDLAKKTVQDPSMANDSQDQRWGVMWDAIPSSEHSSVQMSTLKNDPSLLTIVAFTSQKVPGEYPSNIIKILVRIIISVLHDRAQKMSKMTISDDHILSYENYSSGDESDDDRDSAHIDPATLLRLAHFLMRKLQNIIAESSSSDFRSLTGNILCVLQAACQHSFGMIPKDPYRVSTGKLFHSLRPSHDMLHVALRIASVLLEKIDDSEKQRYNECMSTIFAVLVMSVINCRRMMSFVMEAKEKNFLSRSECHPLIMLHVKYVAVCGTEIASILSLYGNSYSDGEVKESFLIENLVKINDHACVHDKDLSLIVQFASSLSWLWEFLSSANADDTINISKYPSITNAVHKQAASHLLVPVASCICAFVGSCGYCPTNTLSKCFSALYAKNSDLDHEILSTNDYYSSDELLDYECDYTVEQKTLLQCLRKAVQCVGLVFSYYDDREVSTLPRSILVQSHSGYFLPLVVSRVLSKMADFVMHKFQLSATAKSDDIWNEEYPYCFRDAGSQLDLLLHRAYRCLHGISLSGPHMVSLVSKVSAFPIPHIGNLDSPCYYLPESIAAAIRLYRCVRRSYFNCRKRVPSEVFKCILSVLPKEKEDAKVIAVKQFIFSSQKGKDFCCNFDESPRNIMNVDDSFGSLPIDFPSWILQDTANDQKDNTDLTNYYNTSDDQALDIQVVRKGIWQYLANDPLPKLGSTSSNENISYDGSDRTLLERKIAAETELAVSKQLSAIINAIGYEPSDENYWYRAGLCIAVKLNLILDRLIPAERTFKMDHFSPPTTYEGLERIRRKERAHRQDIEKLLKYQRVQFDKSSTRRLNFLGNDLSVYMEHQFCSATSLKALQDSFLKQDSHHPSDSSTKELLRLMTSLFDEENYSLWQHEWGSFFVVSLQNMRRRCFLVALYLSKAKETMVDWDSIYSQVAETFGTALYDEIGFSARKLTDFEKRRKAVLAAKLFESSLESLRSSVATDSNNCPATWESLLMIGKCYEKIANTIKDETHPGNPGRGTRIYELFMHEALESYHKAHVEAKAFEDEGSSLDYQGGGSSHGLLEFTYRLHATRLKVLIASIKVCADEMQSSLHEALRIIERYWFEKPPEACDGKPLSDRLWIAFADIVRALASCRKESPFFHRSVYRHAQAFLWARALYNTQARTGDDFESIPVEKCANIEGLDGGLNYNTSEVILNALFDKKRPQLVAVWVTTPSSPTPFETINDSNRKFDRLRLKYIAAFVESMYCCRRYDQLHVLIKWLNAAPRDLPSFYDVSLKWDLTFSSNNQDCHARDNMLLPSFGLTSFLKKFANGALCRILVQDITSTSAQEPDVTERYSDIYGCFLRLNCPLDNSIWQSQHLRRELEMGAILEADALCTAYQSIFTATEGCVISTLPWDKKFALLCRASKKGQEIYASKDNDMDASKKNRKKRKIDYS